MALMIRLEGKCRTFILENWTFDKAVIRFSVAELAPAMALMIRFDGKCRTFILENWTFDNAVIRFSVAELAPA